MMKTKFNAHLILAITLVTCAFSQQDHCNRYVVITQPSSDATRTCKITLSQLIVYTNESVDRFLVRYFITKAANPTMEIVFQSGIHQVAEITGCQPVRFWHLDRVVIKGQTNVTIDCLNRLFIHFNNVPRFIIQNVKFKNCICHQGFGIVFSTEHLSTATAIILDAKFTNSRLIILNQRNDSVKPLKQEIIVINNTVFEDCCNSMSDLSILYMNHSSGFLGFTMNGINVQNNISPFLFIVQYVPERHLVSSIALIGQNYFTNNAQSIIFIFCSYSEFCTLRFSNTTVHFTNNTVNNIESILNSPITIISGNV